VVSGGHEDDDDLGDENLVMRYVEPLSRTTVERSGLRAHLGSQDRTAVTVFKVNACWLRRSAPVSMWSDPLGPMRQRHT
jgi:hypothetical protein